ncbi:hypothetical protein [Desulfoluna limicola]|nr:hypothetical protein [Desulfoluna limicola]
MYSGLPLHDMEVTIPHTMNKESLTKAPPLLFGFLLVVCLLGFSIYGIHKSYSSAVRDTRQKNQAITDLLAMDIQRTFYAVSQIFIGMSALIDHESFAPHDPSLRRALFSYMNKDPYLMDLLVLNDGAEIIHWTGPGTPPDIRDRKYATSHLGPSPPDFFIGKPKQSKVHTQRWFFGMSHAVRDTNGAVRYILVAIMNLEYFEKMFLKVGVQEGSALLLLADTGEIYCRIPRHPGARGGRLEGIHEIKELLARQPSPIVTSPLDGKKGLVTYRTIGNTKLITAISQCLDSIRSHWWLTNRDILLLSLLLLAAIVAVTSLLYQSHSRLVTAQSGLIRAGATKDILIRQLETALTEVKTLQGILPICASCKKIRDDKGYWGQVEEYIGRRTDAQFSHGICPDCARELYPDIPLDDLVEDNT